MALKKIFDFIRKNNYNPLIILFKVLRFLWKESLGLGLYGIFFFVNLFQKIKLCNIRSERIGHLAVNMELFLRRLRAGYYEKDCLYLGVIAKPCNRQLCSMFKRVFPIIESEFLYTTIDSSIIFKKSKYFKNMPCNSNEYYEFNNLPSTLSFTLEEEEKGRRELAKMGIGPDDWFVCFHARDSKYLEATFLGRDWSYHDFRNYDINNFLKSMDYITEQGGYAIRMGSVVEKPLDNLDNPRIIDYATRYRSDFMDIYLPAKCKFFVGCGSGIDVVGTIFGVSTASTTAQIKHPPMGNKDLFVPKKVKNIKENRILSFKEIFGDGMKSWTNGHALYKAGLEFIECSPKEILELVREMNESLEGRFQYTEEHKELQRRYHDLIKPDQFCYKMPCKMGAFFLRDNKSLLE